MAMTEIKVPDIGDFSEVGVIEVLVKVGDTIKVEQSLITVESDKASMEIPSSHAGVLKELKVQLGDKVSEGKVIAIVETAAASDSAAAPAQAAPAAAANQPQSVAAPAQAAPVPAAAPAAASTIEPKWDGKAFQPRLILPLSLSWDHRVIDGAAAGRFNAYLAQLLADYRRILL